MELLQIKASMWVYCWLFVQLLDHMCCPSTVRLRMELKEEVVAVEQNGTEMVLLGPPDNSHLQKTKLFQNSPTTSAKHETDSFSFLSLNPAKSELMAIFDKIQREVNQECWYYFLLILLFAGWSWNEQQGGWGSGGRGRMGTSKEDRARAMNFLRQRMEVTRLNKTSWHFFIKMLRVICSHF